MSLPLKKDPEMAAPAHLPPTSDMVAELASGLKKIPEVVKASYSLEGGIFYAWILVDPYDTSSRRAIFELQQEMMDHNPEFEFDFYAVAPLETDDPDPLFTQADIAYSRTEQQC